MVAELGNVALALMAARHDAMEKNIDRIEEMIHRLFEYRFKDEANSK